MKGTKISLGSREHRNLKFDFEEQGKMLKYFMGTREQVPQPPPPTREGLHIDFNKCRVQEADALQKLL